MARRNEGVQPLTQAELRASEINFGAEIPAASPLFGGEISPLLGTETSQLASVLAPDPLFENIADPSAAARTQAKANPLSVPGIKKQQSPLVAGLAPLSAGIAAGNQQAPTADLAEAAAGVGLSTLGGVASGALSGATIGAAGGPIGALGGAVIGGLSALVISGAKAWFGVRSARKRNRQLKELQRKAEKQRQDDIARNEKWMRLNRFDNLKIAEENRKQVELQNKWTTYQNVAATMMGLANSDAKLNQTLRNQMLGAS